MKLNCASSRRLPGALVSLFTLLLAIATITTPALPQASDGNIVGTVTDQSGAGIPNATVDLVNSATNVKVSTATAGGFTPGSLKGFAVELGKTSTTGQKIVGGL